MKSRDASIDLIRCTGFLFVVIFHSFLFNGFYYEEQKGALMWLYDSLRWLSYSCNGIFMMLTGYLKCTKPYDKSFFRGLAPILLSYIIASAVSIPIRHFFLNDRQSFSVWLARFMSFGGVYYGWYVKMYIGLLAFAPILNAAMNSLDKRGCDKMLCTMLFMTALPSVTDIIFIPDYWIHIYPMTYYVIGAYIRRFQPSVKPVLCGLTAVLTAMALGAITLISTDGYIDEAYSQGYGGFWITLIAVSVFLALYRLKLPKPLHKPLKWAAGGTFGGYMISHIFDAKLYFALPGWRAPAKWHLSLLCITVPIFFM